MENFGIGPLEIVFIFLIVLLAVGPKDIEKFVRNFGKRLNRNDKTRR
jgi:Sec-independent protein translocase protein TatA